MHPDTVTGAMGEIGAIAGFLDNPACGIVHVLRQGANLPHCFRRLVGPIDNIVELLLLVCSLAEDKGPGYVAAISFVGATKIDQN